jgi:transcriptional regulator with XRE-family HTH domain
MAANSRPKTKPINPRSASVGDKALGEKIRARRILARMSQAELGDHVGVSFQQVQKYEKGVNKVGAVRLAEIAAALGESVAKRQHVHLKPNETSRHCKDNWDANQRPFYQSVTNVQVVN